MREESKHCFSPLSLWLDLQHLDNSISADSNQDFVSYAETFKLSFKPQAAYCILQPTLKKKRCLGCKLSVTSPSGVHVDPLDDFLSLLSSHFLFFLLKYSFLFNAFSKDVLELQIKSLFLLYHNIFFISTIVIFVHIVYA